MNECIGIQAERQLEHKIIQILETKFFYKWLFFFKNGKFDFSIQLIILSFGVFDLKSLHLCLNEFNFAINQNCHLNPIPQLSPLSF